MQNIQKARIQIPEGKCTFGRLLMEPHTNAKAQTLKSFIHCAHEYDPQKLADALRSVLRYPSEYVHDEVQSVKGNVESILFNHQRQFSGLEELNEAANEFIMGRNSLIADFANRKTLSNFLFVPYQDVCTQILLCERKEVKLGYLNTLGVLGNILPQAEKTKLGAFLIGLIEAEEDLVAKAYVIKALSLLLLPESVGPMMQSAEGKMNFCFENIVSKASVLTTLFSDARAFARIMPHFLFGAFTSETKVNAALLMDSFGIPQFTSQVYIYLEDVEKTMDEIKIAAATAAGEAIKRRGYPRGKDPDQHRWKEINKAIKDFKAGTHFDEDIDARNQIISIIEARSGCKDEC